MLFSHMGMTKNQCRGATTTTTGPTRVVRREPSDAATHNRRAPATADGCQALRGASIRRLPLS